MAFVFPTSPSTGDTFSKWTWNGEAWKIASSAREYHGHYSFAVTDSTSLSVDKDLGSFALNPATTSDDNHLPTAMISAGAGWKDAGRTGFSLAGAPVGSIATLSITVAYDFNAAGSRGSVFFKVYGNTGSGNAVFYLTGQDSSISSGASGEEYHVVTAQLPIRSYLIGNTIADAGWISVEGSVDGPGTARITSGEYQFLM